MTHLTGEPYTVTDGTATPTIHGTALLLGIETNDLLDEILRQGAAGIAVPHIPDTWIKQGERRRDEARAALGYPAQTVEILDYLAAQEGARHGWTS